MPRGYSGVGVSGDSVLGTASQITVTDNGDGTITLSLPSGLSLTITGGTINGATIGETTPGTIRGLNKEVTKITTGNLSAVEVSGTILDNYGQTGDCLLTWPTIAEGQGALLRCATTVAKYWGIKVANGSYIWLDGTKGASGGQVTIASAAEGAKLSVVAVKNTAGTYDLDATTISGTWVAA